MEHNGREELLAADLLEEGVKHEARRRGLLETCKKRAPLRRELLKPTFASASLATSIRWTVVSWLALRAKSRTSTLPPGHNFLAS